MTAATEPDDGPVAPRAGRPIGRPRSAEADRAILVAALELFAELGFDGLTVEGVAARAGVGKGTVYRRYPSKVELVMAAARSISESEVPAPDTGVVADDLRAIARGLVHVLTRTPAGAAVVQMVAEVSRNAELAAEHRTFVEARRGMTMRAIRRGIARGEIRADADPALVADALAGPIFYRHLVTGGRLDGAYADRVVEQMLDSLAP